MEKMNNIKSFDAFINEQTVREFYCLIEECTEDGVLNEGKYMNLVKKKFRSFQEMSTAMKAAALAGTVALGTLVGTITASNLGTRADREDLIEQITDGEGDENTEEVIDIYASSFEYSDSLITHLKSYETFRAEPYYATEHERELGKRTIGYGHVIKKNDPQWLKDCTSISEKDALKLLASDVNKFQDAFLDIVETLPEHLQDHTLYTQGFIDASISLMYNCGRGNFLKSPFYNTWKNCRIDEETGKIRLDDYNYTCSMIKKTCITQNGVKLKGLVKRRNIESQMAQIIETDKEVV